MSNVSHAVEQHDAVDSMKWFGIAAGLAVAALLTMFLHTGLHWERFAVGIIGVVCGVLVGTASNGNSANPGSQRFMEFFAVTCALCGVLRFLHIGDILTNVFADSAAMTSVMKFLLIFV